RDLILQLSKSSIYSTKPMRSYQERLKAHGMTQSMSRKGNCLDNAVMENFFGTLKSECFYLREFRSVSALRKAVEDYIHYYNNERISEVVY
ncbi:IS3 family transposase, partial [Klebsiella pneumoniae]|uniref:IS3 family transposase n=1 Tax=Klebsiella pneumoniae TaxID=573 RepID=UPI000B02E110